MESSCYDPLTESIGNPPQKVQCRSISRHPNRWQYNHYAGIIQIVSSIEYGLMSSAEIWSCRSYGRRWIPEDSEECSERTASLLHQRGIWMDISNSERLLPISSTRKENNIPPAACFPNGIPDEGENKAGKDHTLRKMDSLILEVR